MTDKPSRRPRIAIVVGSTRPTRFADKPAEWILEQAKERDWDVEIVDLRDYDLPFFDEMASNLWMPSKNPEAVRWQKKVATFDGFLFMVAEYNRSITGALKNALDQAYVEWNHKVLAAFGYGGTGAARAVEHLRLIGVELQMVPVRNAIHLAGGEMLKVHPMGANGPMSEVEGVLAASVKATFDDIDWWTRATMAAREEDEAAREAA